MILTDVEAVFVDYNKPTQRAIGHMTVNEARAFMAEGQFGGRGRQASRFWGGIV